MDDMADLKTAWTDVADQVSALGLKLKLHAEEELSHDEADDDSFGRIRSAFDDLSDALRDASQDPAVREDFRGVADSLVAAVNATVDEVRSSVSRRT
jgi:hypothetical protein